MLSKEANTGEQATQEEAKKAPAARKEGAGITKRSNSYFVDPRAIARRPGFNPRYEFGEIDELAASIEKNGLLNPLRVQRIGAGEEAPEGAHFWLIDGDRRLTAIEQLLSKGKEAGDVPAMIVDKAQDEVTNLIQMFVANDGKKFLPLEEAMAYKKMRDAGMSVKQICENVGRKHMHVTEILALLEADDSVKEAVRDGKIGKTQAKQIATHAKGDKAKQAELVKKTIAAGKDKGAQRQVKKAIDDSRRAKAAKKGKTLKIRALDDAALSDIGAKLAKLMAEALKNAGKPLDFDVRAWVKEDDNLALAATFGALEAMKKAAGLDIDLGF